MDQPCMSPSLMPLVEQCLSYANDPDPKWVKIFGQTVENTHHTPIKTSIITIEDIIQDTQPMPIVENTENFVKICDLVENELSSKFGLISEECCSNPSLMVYLGENLPAAATDQFFKAIQDSGNEVLIHTYLKNFLPKFLERKSAGPSKDILPTIYKSCRNQFPVIFEEILKNTKIETHILQDFMQNLTLDEKLDVLTCLSSIKIEYKHFDYQQFKNECMNNKDYGRLLLSYLSKCVKKDVTLSDLVEVHSSPMKKACVLVLNRLQEV